MDQSQLLEIIKTKLAPGEKLVDALEQILFIGKDSAYRRIRGETIFSMDEFIKIITHFSLSVDQLVGLTSSNKAALFYSQDFNDASKYMEFVGQEFNKPQEAKDFEMIYSSQGLPIYYIFNDREIAAFKAFYHYRLFSPDSENLPKYDYKTVIDLMETQSLQIMKDRKKIALNYLNTPTTEIWNVNTFDGHLQQLSYAIDIGLFKDKEAADLLLDNTIEMLNTVQKQAEIGKKLHSDYPGKTFAKFDLYFMEAMLLDHICYKRCNDKQTVFFLKSTGTFVYSSNENYCSNVYNNVQSIIKKSAYISNANEKDRHRLFSTIEKKVMAVKSKLNQL